MLSLHCMMILPDTYSWFIVPCMINPAAVAISAHRGSICARASGCSKFHPRLGVGPRNFLLGLAVFVVARLCARSLFSLLSSALCCAVINSSCSITTYILLFADNSFTWPTRKCCTSLSAALQTGLFGLSSRKYV